MTEKVTKTTNRTEQSEKLPGHPRTAFVLGIPVTRNLEMKRDSGEFQSVPHTSSVPPMPHLPSEVIEPPASLHLAEGDGPAAMGSVLLSTSSVNLFVLYFLLLSCTRIL